MILIHKIVFANFRRTMATRAIEKGMPIEQVQRNLGHEQIDTALRYAMVNQRRIVLNGQSAFIKIYVE